MRFNTLYLARYGSLKRLLLCSLLLVLTGTVSHGQACDTPKFTTIPVSVTAFTTANSCSPLVSFIATLNNAVGVNLSYSLNGATLGNGSGTGSGISFNRGVTHLTITASRPCITRQFFIDIIVKDAIKPVFGPQSNITVNNAPGLCGAKVDYVVPRAIDNCPDCTVDLIGRSGFNFLGEFKGHYYFTTSFRAPFNQIDSNIGTVGAHLVSINSYSEDSFIAAKLPDSVLAWIGFTDRDDEGVWKWTDGSPVTYTNWCNTQPDDYLINQDWAALNSDVPGQNGSCWDDGHSPIFPRNGLPNNFVGILELDVCGTALVRTAGLDSGGFFPIGTTKVTYRATDGAGNVDSISFNVTVLDAQAPVITCPPNRTLGCKPNTDTTTSGTGRATATDNCGIAALYKTDVSTRALDSLLLGYYNYTITRKWTAIDINGNISTCTQLITVKDSVLPVAICKNISLTLVNGVATLTAAQINNGSYDLCSGIGSLTASKTSFTCANIGTNQVVLTVKDRAGNTSTCTATVTIVGANCSCSITVTPCVSTYTGGVATNIYLGYGPQKATLTANGTGGGTYTYLWSGPTSKLSCTTCKSPVFTPTAAGNYTFTVTIRNGSGCTSTCAVTFCVQDIRVPDDCYDDDDDDHNWSYDNDDDDDRCYSRWKRDWDCDDDDDDYRCRTSSAKVYLCHKPYWGSAYTIKVKVSDVSDHIGCHSSDKLGKCSQLCGTTARRLYEPENFVGSSVKVYPNPTSGTFFVNLPYFEKEATVTITDMQGKVIQQSRFVDGDGHKQQFNLGAIARGIYIVDVVYDGQRVRNKVVLQ